MMYSGKTKKGISPLIAVVLMVAFTIAIAGFVSSWMNQTVRKQTENAINNSDPGCYNAYLDAKNAAFNSSGTEKLTFTVRNTGMRTLTIDKIRVNAGNSNSSLFTTNYVIYAGDEVPVSLQIDTNTIDSISSVRVMPKECPSSSVTIEETEIS